MNPLLRVEGVRLGAGSEDRSDAPRAEPPAEQADGVARGAGSLVH